MAGTSMIMMFLKKRAAFGLAVKSLSASIGDTKVPNLKSSSNFLIFVLYSCRQRMRAQAGKEEGAGPEGRGRV